MADDSLTFSGPVRSVRFAIKGIRTMLRTQHNAWIHAAATAAVAAAGVMLGLSASEWCWIVLAVMAVWTAEALNTAFEFLTDVASPSFHPLAGRAKDVAAGAVLISAVGAVVIGLLVFGPHIRDLLVSVPARHSESQTAVSVGARVLHACRGAWTGNVVTLAPGTRR